MGGLIRESQNLQYVNRNNGDRGKGNVYLVWFNGLTLIGGLGAFSRPVPHARHTLEVAAIPSTCIKSWTRIFSVGEVHTLRYIEEGAKRLGVSPCHGSYTGAYNDALFYLLYDVAFASPSFHPLNNSRYMVNHTEYWCLHASILTILTVILSSAN